MQVYLLPMHVYIILLNVYTHSDTYSKCIFLCMLSEGLAFNFNI